MTLPSLICFILAPFLLYNINIKNAIIVWHNQVKYLNRNKMNKHDCTFIETHVVFLICKKKKFYILQKKNGFLINHPFSAKKKKKGKEKTLTPF
jgi:hypothetical protein